MVDNAENIFVDFDYNNIIIVDPNKVVDGDGKAKERYVKQENLVIYANLECSVLPRTKLAIGTPQNLDAIQTISIAEINFLNPGKKNFLDNEYTNEITGQNTLKGGGDNQTKLKKVLETGDDGKQYSYIRQSKLNQTDNGLLGITNIQIRQGLDFTPQITITLEDIKGRALFESGPNSPYGAFFHLPYPPFYLTLKGYFGKAIRLTLMLSKFNARYDSLSGNFKVTLDFYTYKYSVLVEVPMGHLLAVPYMYPTIYQQDGSQGNNTARSLTFTSELGRQKLDEVYEEYKSKNLIPKNFQSYTIKDLYEVLSRFIKDTLNGFIDTNLQPLTELDDFQKNLARYEGEVYSFGVDLKTKLGSLFELYMDKKNFYVTNKGEQIYYVKKGYKPIEVESQLKSLVDTFNERLDTNRTCGQLNGSYKRKSNNPNSRSVTINTKVPNSIKLETFLLNRKIEDSEIDAKATIQKRKGIKDPSPEEEDFIIQQFKFDNIDKGTRKLNKLTQELDPPEITWFIFDGDGRFLRLISEMKKSVEIIKTKIQDDITESLAEFLQQQKPLGFIPNIRNVLAVFFANAEAFLRLMDRVHDKAWNLNNQEDRIKAILGDTYTFSADKQRNNEKIVYPWPQLVNQTERDGKVLYELRYPGDETIKEQTKADNYDTWPEVEFVEEYIKALVEKVSRDTKTREIANELNDINRLSINGIEFPVTNEVYFNQEIVKFFYEIFERIVYTIYYSRINKAQPNILYNLISEIESKNIYESLKNGSSPELTIALKNSNVNGGNYQSVLKEISNNGLGISWNTWISGIFNTIYINNKVNSSFIIRPDYFMNRIKTKPDLGLKQETQAQLQEWLTGSTKSNKIDFTDSYPFTNDSWIKNNLADGVSTNSVRAYNTTNTLNYQVVYKNITNFKDIGNVVENRPVTYFVYKNQISTQPITYSTLKDYYSDLETNYKKQLITEGNLYYSSAYDGNVSKNQLTSILNTPYFVNAIQKGVELQKSRATYPYVAAAYLFLNGLPLITGKEKLKNNINGSQTEVDYIYAGLKKYGATHRLPYAWILKIGSVWYRYQKFINEGVDILNDVWTDFDYVKNYDPTGNTTTKRYNFTASSVNYNVVLERTYTTGSDTTTLINLGFYPKLINDFSYFYIGREIIGSNYDNQDIQKVLDSGKLSLIRSDSASFLFGKGVDPNNFNRDIITYSWSSYLSGDTSGFYLLPSVGGINQTKVECFDNSEVATAKLKKELVGNKAMYNGSVRNFWLASNFGYFDNSAIGNPPSAQKYLKNIFVDKSDQENFSINFDQNRYTTIEELFSIFDYKVLDYFKEEFLNYCKADTNFNTPLVEIKTSGRLSNYNFQLMMKSMMKVSEVKPETNVGAAGSVPGAGSVPNAGSVPGAGSVPNNNTSPELLYKYSVLQAKQINTFLENFLQDDVYFVYGNPSNYNKKLFYSFSLLPLEGKFKWELYTEVTPNSLPTTNNIITLAQSKSQKPTEWRTLETYVGFSTISELQYKDNGSYITDFFIDFNVAFTTVNIKNFAPIIKLYATQKLNATQTNKINTDQTIDADIILYNATLSDNTTLQITQNNNGKSLTQRNGSIIIFGKSYSPNLSVQDVLNDFFSIFPNLSVQTQNNLQPTDNFPTNPSSSFGSDGSTTFQNKLTNYLNSNEQDISQIINTFWPTMTSELSNIKAERKRAQVSQLQGDPQTKLELWELFKSLNDKWIAGNDYQSKTLFEDVMLVDRASRNIGEQVLVDIFSLKEMIDPTLMNLKTDVITFVESILVTNNFVVMTLPAYVNFYGIQNVSGNAQPVSEGTIDFANTLFGTFMNVDYRNSSSKLVCQFVDRTSEHLDMSENNPDYRFRDDSFDITRVSDHPLTESLENKTDFDKSNKVVGFNVDIGVQNQQIIKSFSVGQNAGLATAEALEILNQMANQGGHRSVATQNMSLYTLYKNRSYTCNLSMMGNALIQPTMYFNLRYVPMFSGPYMITEVNHSISPGDFSTDIVGVRQPIASLPILTNFLQGLRTNLIKKVDEKITIFSKNSPNAKATNIINQKTAAGTKDDSLTTIPPNENCKTTVAAYNTLSPVEFDVSPTFADFKQMKDSIYQSLANAGIPTDIKLAKVIFAYFYYNNGKTNGFESQYNNFGGVNLLQDWGAKSQYFEITPRFFCKTENPPNLNTTASANNNNSSAASKVTPFATFGTLNLHTRFFVDWWKLRTERIVEVSNTNPDVNAESIVKFIIINRDPTSIKNDAFYDNFKKTEKNTYERMLSDVKTAINIFDRT